MVKLLSIVSLILAIVLFPPATLAVISNNAVPGDATYPIKRALEDGIFAIASLHPTTRAWFAAARSDRRFKEFTTLVAQGKKGGETLNELVEQTQIAANQIANVSDESQKEKLAEQLSQSIKKYDQGLQQVSSPVPANPAPVAQTTPLPQTTPTLSPPSAPTPTSQPIPQPTPRPTIAPAPVVTPPIDDKQKQIDEARKQLEEIRRRLEEEQRKQREHSSQNESPRQQIRQESNDKKEDKQEKKEDKDGSDGRRENSSKK